jgi:Outer membrane protein beta-barrel domain
MMRTKLIGSLLSLMSVAALPASGQERQEIGIAAGRGRLAMAGSAQTTPVLSFWYQGHATKRVSVEGGFDFFSYTFHVNRRDPASYLYRDGYSGASIALVYYPLTCSGIGRVLPYVAAGVGKTTTDFTEIPATVYYRLGAGVAYNLSNRIGLRVEAREEIISALDPYVAPRATLPSLRFGIVRRF